MTFGRYLLFDVREGLRATAVSLAALALVAAAVVGAFWLKAASYGTDWMSFTLGDNLVGVLAGMKLLDLSALNSRFVLPVSWVLVVLLIAAVPLGYPYRNIMGFGRSVLVAGGSRLSWWLSKCVWVVLCVCFAYAVVVVVAAAMTMCAGGELTFDADAFALGVLDIDVRELRELPRSVLPFLAVVPVAASSLCVLQLALSLAIRPVMSFAATIALVVASIFFPLPVLAGNYLMAARAACLFSNGSDVGLGVALCLAVAACAIVVGGIAFCRMDIIDKEFNA